MARPQTAMRLRWPLAFLLVTVLQASLLTLPQTAAQAQAPAFTSQDIGFAEGARPDAGGIERRLDGIARFAGDTAPILRVDLDWWYVEPCRGCALRWDRLDRVVDAANARGMRVLLVLAYAPPWANGGHANDKWFPTRNADWTSIIDRTVRHFGDKVQAYEVWNEPNVESFGNYAGNRKKRYWELVRLAYRRIHRACDDCVVLAGASGNGTPATQDRNDNESARWLDWAYRNGYGQYFDAVAHHPYPAWNSGKGPAEAECRNRWWNLFGPPGQNPPCGELAYVRSVMVAHGDAAKKIWATEWGYPTSGSPRQVPLETVRDHMVQGVQMWRALDYTGPLFLYSFRDACSAADDPECNFGVVTEDFRPKEPLYSDLSAALTGVWPPALQSGGALRQGSALRSQDGRFELWLQEDGNLVLYRQRDAKPLWATNTRDGAVLRNQPDGNLVLYRADGKATWSTGTHGSGRSTLWVQEDGNLVLYRASDAAPTWASNTAGS